MKEIEILRIVNHENVIKLYEVYESNTHLHLVFEFLGGGELLEHIKQKGIYTESDAAQIIGKILEALDYCHKKKIVHRDLKPENLILR